MYSDANHTTGNDTKEVQITTNITIMLNHR